MGTLSTRLVVEGEAEYKRAISSANTELKALGSEMNLLSQQSKGAANSLEALTQKQDILTRTLETQQSKYDAINAAIEANQKAIADLTRENEDYAHQLEEANEQLEKMDKNAEGAEKKQQDLQKTIQKLNDEIKKNGDQIQKLQDNTNRWQDSSNKAAIELNKLQNELSETQGYIAEAQDNTDGLATSIDGFGKAAESATPGAKQFSSGISAIFSAFGINPGALKNFGIDVDELGEKLEAGAGSANGFAAGITGIVAAGAGIAAEAKMIKEMAEAVIAYKREEAGIERDIQLQMDQTPQQAQKTMDQVQHIYDQGYGSTRENVANALQDIQQFLGVTGDEAEDLAKKALILQEVWGPDITTTIGTVNTLMKEFGISAGDAFDMIASGFGEFKDLNGDMMNTFSDYASVFSDLGFSAQEMYNMIKAAGDEGASSLSGAAQLIQQFYQNAIMEKDNFAAALEELGFDSEEMMNRIAAGGEDAAAAMGEINAALAGVGDEATRAQLAADLFGRGWTKVGEDVVDAMTGATESMDDFSGAAESMAATYENSMATAMDKADRLLEKLKELGNEAVLNAAFGGIPQVVETAYTAPVEIGNIIDQVKQFSEDWNNIGDNMSWWDKLFSKDLHADAEKFNQDFQAEFAKPLTDAMDQAIKDLDRSGDVEAAGEATLGGLITAAENQKPAIVAAFEEIGIAAADALMSNIPEWAFGGLPGASNNGDTYNVKQENHIYGTPGQKSSEIGTSLDEMLGKKIKR